MNIVIIGEKAQTLDEGMKNAAFHITSCLAKKNKVVLLNLKSPVMMFVNTLILQPEIIHYIPGPSFMSFIIGKILKVLSPHSRIILSAPHPTNFPLIQQRFLKHLKPDLMIVHSKRTKIFFKKIGIKTIFLPWGVETKKFSPITSKERNTVRKKYSISENAFVILHVGHLRKGRNLMTFNALPDFVKKIIIASPSIKKNFDPTRLKNTNIIKKYFKNINLFYGLADCYFFPTISPKDAVEIPLSVLEAMSTGIPVISSRFGGLPDIIDEDKGFYYFDDPKDLPNLIEMVIKDPCNNNRQKILELSWDNVCKKLFQIYLKVL